METEIWQKYRDQGVVVLGVSGGGAGHESTSTVEAFREQTGVTFPLLLGDNTVFKYDLPGGSISPYPVDVIVDRGGTIRYLAGEFDREAMQATIETLLAE